MLYRGIIKSSAILSLGGISTAVLTFSRNLIIARLIGVENFGVAATFAIVISLGEMSSNLGLNLLLIQAKDGDNPRFQASLQAFGVFRGIMLALIIFLLAEPISMFFSLPEVLWAYRLLAIVPLIDGFSHYDSSRFQRHMKFGPSVWIETVPIILSLIIVIPLANYTEDYRVVLFITITSVIIKTALSHLLANRSYELVFDMAVLKRTVSFGWPLLINGFLLFCVFQADNTLVGVVFGVEDLGWFSVAFALTIAPSHIFGKLILSLLIPKFRGIDLDRFKESEIVQITYQVCFLAGTIVSVGFIVGGPALIILFYGESYAAATSVIGLLGITQGFRMAKSTNSIVAISTGKTHSIMYVNIVRGFSVVLGLVSIWLGFGILGLVLSTLAAEIVSTIVAYCFVNRISKLPMRSILFSGLTCVGLIILAEIFAIRFIAGENPFIELLISIGAVSVCGLICLMTMPTIYKLLWNIVLSVAWPSKTDRHSG